ncbi:uncharacterized protein PHACADRAFT_248774 [Phanerochaete carnosa HHB-10118-sp]|uniref:Secreted protein n=1 Tax=Phanerochaete carnosa (strain HHB-10118-sp) TaxID=650164 RepID=K5WD58_PHACS|nr:uncharacterized protein PHACADRAFT_248774 [Phanerochaete carnosa HHB-10118-sp]EKM61873.1 hypothetical protein PHACADRAFT_248774 [Phanerochaete carnosa HHB-10118-sp]
MRRHYFHAHTRWHSAICAVLFLVGSVYAAWLPDDDHTMAKCYYLRLGPPIFYPAPVRILRQRRTLIGHRWPTASRRLAGSSHLSF